jgi:hypothetical protein
VTIVDMPEKGDITVRTAPLYPLHDVRMIEGMLDDLMNMPYSEDYLWVTVHDELPPPDARVTLSVNFPNMMKFSIVNSRTKQDIDVLATFDAARSSYHDQMAYGYDNPKQPNVNYVACMITDLSGTILTPFKGYWIRPEVQPEPEPEPEEPETEPEEPDTEPEWAQE